MLPPQHDAKSLDAPSDPAGLRRRCRDHILDKAACFSNRHTGREQSVAATLICGRRFRPSPEATRNFWRHLQITALAACHWLCSERKSVGPELVRFHAESRTRSFPLGVASAQGEACARQGFLDSSPPTPPDGQIAALESSSDCQRTEIVVSNYDSHLRSESFSNVSSAKQS